MTTGEQQCETCGIDISGKRTKARFCSKQCSSESRKRKLVCEWCGAVFHGGHAQKFCSSECRGNARKRQRICAYCGKTFTRTGQNQPKHCSPECWDAARSTGVNLTTYTCAKCGIEFERYAAHVRNPERVYCSSDCYFDNRVYPVGPDHPQWRGGTFVKDGYVMERDLTRRKGNGAYAHKAQHVRVAEETAGRSVIKGEHVHHLNGNTMDNRPENLLIVSNGHHRALHGFYANQFQLEHEAAGDLLEITLAFLATLENGSVQDSRPEQLWPTDKDPTGA